jgi:hypothetical protein
VQPYILEARIDIPYRWTAGEALGRALEGLKEGRLLGTQCPGCGRKDFPARTICKACFGKVSELVEFTNRGVLETFTVTEKDGSPIVYGIVRVEGSQIGLVHLINPALAGELRKGLVLKAVFQAPENRSGHIRDIRYFDLEGAKCGASG